MQDKYAVGLMSGTSLDGVDAVLVKLNGFGTDTQCEVIEFTSLDISDDLRSRILKASHPETSSVDLICSLNFELGDIWSQAVQKVLKKADFKGELDFVASHGQTIYHMPKAEKPFYRSTLQIGDPSQIAYDHHTQVVFNFRPMDMIAGGDGAPLVPYTEFILYSRKDESVLLQNIGGIGNVTIIPKNCGLEDVTAFDTGPGNMMMNAATAHFYNEPYDKDAQYGFKGQLIPELYDELINHPYLKLLPPKSTGREMFGEDVVADICKRFTEPNDVIYTLTKFTAFTIADAYKKYVFDKLDVDQIILGGGGAYNPLLIKELKEMLPDDSVVTQEDLGFSSDAKEAVAFAILGNETLNNVASNVPSATGSDRRVVLGQICPKPF